ncbi:hypothetical protein ACIG3E_36670 [Streptomyces sp. NPDC053474]|uniref:hypothetical protein n=1 Tax=Streptomyces sp. NPDC053474 TaxID=3365704 RepID=UPI0037CE2B09
MDASAAMVEFARSREEHPPPRGIRYEVCAADAVCADVVGVTGTCDTVTAVYLLPYASTWDGLAGMCTAARRALHESTGRFVAVVLNPDFATDPHWYRPYGMSLTVTGSGVEGATGHLTAWVGQDVLELDFFTWSRAAHEQALREAGFTEVRWSRPGVSARGLHRFGEAFWRPYLQRPHALVVEARTSPPAGRAATNPRPAS